MMHSTFNIKVSASASKVKSDRKATITPYVLISFPFKFPLCIPGYQLINTVWNVTTKINLCPTYFIYSSSFELEINVYFGDFGSYLYTYSNLALNDMLY